MRCLAWPAWSLVLEARVRSDGAAGVRPRGHGHGHGPLPVVSEEHELVNSEAFRTRVRSDFATTLPADWLRAEEAFRTHMPEREKEKTLTEYVTEWIMARIAELRQRMSAAPDPASFLTQLPSQMIDPRTKDMWRTQPSGGWQDLDVTVAVELPIPVLNAHGQVVAKINPFASVESLRLQLWGFLTGAASGPADAQFLPEQSRGTLASHQSLTPVLEVYRTRHSTADGRAGREHYRAFKFTGSPDNPAVFASRDSAEPSWEQLHLRGQGAGLHLADVWDWQLRLRAKSKEAAPQTLLGSLCGGNGC